MGRHTWNFSAVAFNRRANFSRKSPVSCSICWNKFISYFFFLLINGRDAEACARQLKRFPSSRTVAVELLNNATSGKSGACFPGNNSLWGVGWRRCFSCHLLFSFWPRWHPIGVDRFVNDSLRTTSAGFRPDVFRMSSMPSSFEYRTCSHSEIISAY